MKRQILIWYANMIVNGYPKDLLKEYIRKLGFELDTNGLIIWWV